MLKEIFRRRDLIRELVLKDLKIRYSRPLLGFAWAFLSPLLTVAIFYVVFSVILQVKTKEAPFLLYLMSAVFTWRFFQDSVASSTTSLVDNKNLVLESQLPHYLIPLSIILANAVNFLPSLFILIITSLFFLKGLPVFIVFLPVILAVHLILTTGISLISSIVYVRFRDMKYVVEALLPILFYLTPAFYSIYLVKDSLPPSLFNLYIYNPFVGVLFLYRLAVLRGFYPAIGEEIGLPGLIICPLIFSAIIFLLGIRFYKRNEKNINDHISY
ncbi:MAG: ABC transporter permease [Candidatus Omnitrophica bacterium]|nr:ABC transporter permease [Candidatus Omnitrophota bacterium]MDD5552420.1 ABC transporter permease [Candidatus Omnitrophota bacterium]